MKNSHAIYRMLAVALCVLGAAAILAPDAGSATSQAQGATPSAEAPLTNADIVKLSELKLGDDVIIAKIRQAKNVAFKLDTDDLVELKDKGVSSDVITAMLERSGPKDPNLELVEAARDMAIGKSWTSPGIFLRAKDGDFNLIGRTGDYSHTYAYVTMLTFLNIDGTVAEIRTTDRQPTIVASFDDDPRRSRVYLVELDSDEDDNWRSLKIGKMRFASIDMSGRPDDDWTIPYDAKQDEDGLWHLTPKKPLKPGEYGVYFGQSIGGFGVAGEIYDFGVDK